MGGHLKTKATFRLPPLRAYADSSKPLSLALAAATTAELVSLTRGVWNPPQTDCPPQVIDIEDGEDPSDSEGYIMPQQEERISAAIKVTRLTFLKPIGRSSHKKRKGQTTPADHEQPPTKRSKIMATETLSSQSHRIRSSVATAQDHPDKPDPSVPSPSPSRGLVTSPSPSRGLVPSPSPGLVPSPSPSRGLVPSPSPGLVTSPSPSRGLVLSPSHATIETASPASPASPREVACPHSESPQSDSKESGPRAAGFVFTLDDVDESTYIADFEASGDEGDTCGDILPQGCPSLKAWNQRERLFSRFDHGIIMDETAWFEVSPENCASHVAQRLSKAIAYDEGEATTGDDSDNRRPVLAACCGVGGDAIQLAKHVGSRVVAVDISEDKVLRICRHNAGVYEVADKMEFVAADIADFARDKTAEVKSKSWTEVVEMPIVVKGITVKTTAETVARTIKVRPFSWAVMSPPWGGPEYRQLYAFNLGAQTFMDLIHLIQSVMMIADNLCLILPRNQDLTEIIHLAAQGSPDGDRFSYVEVEKLSESRNGYPVLVAVYLCRSPALFCCCPCPLEKAPQREIAKLDAHKAPPLVQPETEPLPNIEVSTKTVFEIAGKKGDLKIDKIHNMIFCRFLLVYLEEPTHQIRTTGLCLQLLGLPKFLEIVEETIRLVRAGGVHKAQADQGLRTKGGVFFEVLKRMSPSVNRVMRKWRKKSVGMLRAQKDEVSLPIDDDSCVVEEVASTV